MLTTVEYLSLLREYMRKNSAKYGISRMGIFGSVARGEQREGSDVDICVEIDRPSIFTLVHIKEELEKLLKCPVDVVRLRNNMDELLRGCIKMEFMCKSQIIESLLKKILQTVERILANSETITSPSFYLLTPSGMERLESTCMLLIAIGEGVKGVDKLTDKKLLSFYPGMDWKGVMGMRDIIAHHYFDLDAEIVYDVIKHDLPKLKDVLQQIVDDLKVSNQAID